MYMSPLSFVFQGLGGPALVGGRCCLYNGLVDGATFKSHIKFSIKYSIKFSIKFSSHPSKEPPRTYLIFSQESL